MDKTKNFDVYDDSNKGSESGSSSSDSSNDSDEESEIEGKDIPETNPPVCDPPTGSQSTPSPSADSDPRKEILSGSGLRFGHVHNMTCLCAVG